jgi:hypothetical protein
LKRLLRTPSTGEKFPLAFLSCMPESLRQTRSRFGTQRKREGSIDVVERTIANAPREPMWAWLRRLSRAGYLPVHDRSSVMDAVPRIT